MDEIVDYVRLSDLHGRARTTRFVWASIVVATAAASVSCLLLDDWALSATCAGLVLVASITAALLGMVLFAPPQNFEEMMGIPAVAAGRFFPDLLSGVRLVRRLADPLRRRGRAGRVCVRSGRSTGMP